MVGPTRERMKREAFKQASKRAARDNVRTVVYIRTRPSNPEGDLWFVRLITDAPPKGTHQVKIFEVGEAW